MFVPWNEGNTVWMEHHLYVCDKNSEELRRHIAFRDYLREHTKVANEYGNLKEELARESKNRSSYIEGKTVFITNILENKLRQRWNTCLYCFEIESAIIKQI